MKIVIIFIVFLSSKCFACRPQSNFIAPSLEDNYKKSEIVFRGKIISKVDNGKSTDPFGNKYTLSFQVGQNLKGATEKIVNLITFSNTCDTFGQFAEPNSECLIFATQGDIHSGVLSGEASFCGNAKLLNQKIEEISSFKTKPK
jgi:hypothetical protein